MKKNFFRRRSISYRGRGNFATQLSFSQPIVKLAVWLYFIICILVIGTRVFFMTQADHYRDEITALVSEAAGVDVHAGEFSAGFERFWPVITVRQLELARPGGPVSLTLPEVKARLAWSSLWHLEPRFQLLRISSPDLRITRLDKTTLDIAGFVVNLPEGSDEESNFAASGDSRVAAWLLAQKKLELVNGTITYDDRKKCRFVTACAAADFHDNVFLVIRVFRNEQNGDFFLQFFQTLFVFRQFFLHQLPEIVIQFILQKFQFLRNVCFHFFVFPICLHNRCHIAVFLHQFPPLALVGNDFRVVDLICQIHILLFNFRQSVKHEAPPSSVQRPRDPALPSPDGMPRM